MSNKTEKPAKEITDLTVPTDFLDHLYAAEVARIQGHVWHPAEQVKQFEELEKDLAELNTNKEKYPKVKYFLDELFAAKMAEDDGLYFDALENLVSSISKHALTSPGNLNSFMVNYFYDDAYFSIDFNGEVFLASWANDSGESECQDDPKILVAAAKFNANYQWEKINNPNETNDDDQSPAPGN